MIIEINNRLLSLKGIKTVHCSDNGESGGYFLDIMYHNDSSLIFLKYDTRDERDTDYNQLKELLLNMHEYA